MPDKKPSVSSADDPLVEAEASDAKFPGRRCSVRRILLATLIALGLLMTLAAVCTVVMHFWMARRGGCGDEVRVGACGSGSRSQPLYVNLVIDASAIPECQSPLSLDSVLPCMRARKLLTGGTMRANGREAAAFPLGPMACIDDAFVESGGPNNCEGNPFQLVENRTGVLIPETGVYRVHSRVTFSDANEYYVSALVRITPADCAANPACAGSRERREKRDHAWLSCFNHARPRSRENSSNQSQISPCTIDGVRRFSRGDVVSLQMTQKFRSVNPFGKVTQLLIHKL